jgi:hypothetical protein
LPQLAADLFMAMSLMGVARARAPRAVFLEIYV